MDVFVYIFAGREGYAMSFFLISYNFGGGGREVGMRKESFPKTICFACLFV